MPHSFSILVLTTFGIEDLACHVKPVEWPWTQHLHHAERWELERGKKNVLTSSLNYHSLELISSAYSECFLFFFSFHQPLVHVFILCRDHVLENVLMHHLLYLPFSSWYNLYPYKNCWRNICAAVCSRYMQGTMTDLRGGRILWLTSS